MPAVGRDGLDDALTDLARQAFELVVGQIAQICRVLDRLEEHAGGSGDGGRVEARRPRAATPRYLSRPWTAHAGGCGGRRGAVTRPRSLPLADTLDHQRRACARAGSSLYAELLAGIAADVEAGGVCAKVLGPRAGEPLASALALRFLGAVHRLVLEGRAPALAAHYPSAGGRPGPGLVADFLATVAELRPAIEDRLDEGVQTNEVGRSAVLAPGYALVARRSGLPLRVLELGASAGLNLRWDRYWYDTGETCLGDPDSPVRFEGAWQPVGGGPLPDLGGPVEVAERAGCDRNPIDVGTEDGRLRLRSFLWPDQVDRLARLEAAFAVAARVPAPVDAADLGAWAEARLAEPVEGVATVVAHTIVWQYVDGPSRDRLRAALRRAGERATPDAPVAWLRFEPAGAVGDLRLTWWPGGTEQVLATAEYHGVPVYWGHARSAVGTASP
nr:DUF2332 domain-containing protein [Thermoanaerobacterales bacterium]